MNRSDPDRRLILTCASLLVLACNASDPSADEGGSVSGAWYGEAPEECAEPSVDGVILACGGMVRDFTIDHDRVLWIGGSLAVCNPECPPPALYSVERAGGPRTKLQALEEHPEAIALASRLYIGAGEAIYATDPQVVGAELSVVEGQAAKHLAAGDGFVTWVGYLDGVLWAFWEDDGSTVQIAAPAETITAIDAREHEVAWMTDSGRLSVRDVTAPEEDDEEVYQLGRAGRHLAFDDRTVFIGDEEGLRTVSRDTGAIDIISSERISAVAINADAAFFLVEDRATIMTLSREGTDGAPTSLFEEVEDNSIFGLAVDESDLFWIDGRIIKRSL